MSKEFKREERYIVVKIKDAKHIDREEPFNGYDRLRDFLKQSCIPTREALVIEKDWPEYEPTWAAIERRVTCSQWSGEGLPPAGLEVEWKQGSNHEWVRSKVIAYFKDEAWISVEGDRPIIVGNPGQFRLIRTPEQIAADELQRAVQQIMVDAGITDSALKDDPEAWVWAQALHEAGYRKQVATINEVIEALRKVLCLKGTLKQHGLLEEVEAALAKVKQVKP